MCDLFLDVICEFYGNDNKARTFGTDTELYHSEIHMLQCIEDYPGLHISGLARVLGITRGAASQTVKRLERKNMIVKEAVIGDNKKIAMRLTGKGKTAYCNHKSSHEKYNAILTEFLVNSDTAQLEFLTDFLNYFKKALIER